MYGLIEKESDLKAEDAIYDECIGAGLGWIHELKKGQSFRIVDLVFASGEIRQIASVEKRQFGSAEIRQFESIEKSQS